ncbi:hypothetical protein DDZ18_10910 [Marinicauda salina]|uniref:Metal-dependent hydrolase n=1 Tax=Marinicauda salina TaxID=2135793 RepID=A0A2U2BRT8_9PROT|nr:hypothetical protein [Marinicauda salina]PWE16712.1 hypothetical protein DDZ18_10910 [Marinicauda salina]
MFIGHYGPAFAGPRFVKTVPLWALFLSVQIVDVAWGIFVALGIERVRVEPGFTAMSPFDLYHMPWTHSLLAALAWAVAIGAVYAVFARADRIAGAVVMGLASFSHWLLDLIVHVPDLPLWPGGPKVGFGLWNNYPAALGLEVVVLLAGFALYLAATRPKTPLGRWTPWGLVALLGLFEGFHLTNPPEGGRVMVGLSTTAVFLILTLAAWGVDRTRQAK